MEQIFVHAGQIAIALAIAGLIFIVFRAVSKGQGIRSFFSFLSTNCISLSFLALILSFKPVQDLIVKFAKFLSDNSEYFTYFTKGINMTTVIIWLIITNIVFLLARNSRR